ncbi:uncharacterized protein LOC108704231 [Xenopus laevis]|uniref:Uncharacterized protein LOC108704231 n=1 Tax=Xenopus laevis TaxID=8355 RepID=A0A8J1M022_XENLA|nr:uncharacterized protein LOC108704231 [Xenopus laevis]XP_041435092.1 uncharacterized protein LOC108704231 [Xenopus laevis]XP_041435093.1 uncharacterized protein LOC108704231 [Xenopus laevis]OCT58310.1 hypothetical protein XELAEV_18002248mg [Xenopus laevis]
MKRQLCSQDDDSSEEEEEDTFEHVIYKNKKMRLILDGDKVKNTIGRIRSEAQGGWEVTRRPSVQLAGVSVGLSSTVNMIDKFDRPLNFSATGPYVEAGYYEHRGENSPGKRIPKAGAMVGAGLGRVSAECGVCDFEAKGPNVSAGVEVSATGASAMARAEVASVSASVGPLNATLALGVDTGLEVGEDGFEVQFLGTGFKVGPRSSVSLLGCKLEFP